MLGTLALLTLVGALKCTTCHPAEKYEGPVTDRHPVLPCASCHVEYVEMCKQGKGEPSSAAGECKSCHAGVFGEWTESSHGRALLEKKDQAAPHCSGCHG